MGILKIPRITTAQRITTNGGITPDEGELLFDTDNQKIYKGDGTTLGGVEVGGGKGIEYTTTDSTVANTYTATIAGISSYAEGDIYAIKFNVTNTGASTLQINSLTPAKSIVKNANTALAANDILANKIYILVYDGTSFQLTNALGEGGGGLLYGSTLTSTNTYATTISGVVAYTEGDAYLIKFVNGNDDDSSININGLGARNLVKQDNIRVTGGDILPGQELLIVFDGAQFQCIGVAPNQLFAYVTNDDTVTINKGQPVHAFGAAGSRMSVKLASNSQDSTSAQTVGLVYSSSIAAGQKGFIITQGVLSGLNTSAFSPGNQLYLGATAGTLTATKPVAPNHLVYIGIVERANNGNGQIYVKPQNGYELDELHDVLITSPATGHYLYYDNTDGLWKNSASWQGNTIAVAKLPLMVGATISTNGTAGLVPAPAIAERNLYLTGAGTWATQVATGTISSGSDRRLAIYTGTTTLSSATTAPNSVIVSIASATAARTYTIPDTGTSTASFIMSQGTQTISGALTLNAAGSTTTAQLTFSGSPNNWINFGGNGVAPPAITTARSAGTKIVIGQTFASPTTADYAIGLNTSDMWFSTALRTTTLSFYAADVMLGFFGGGGPVSAGNPSAGLTLNASGANNPQLYISGATRQWIGFASATGAPTLFASRPNGMKIMIRQAFNGTDTMDDAIGFENFGIWYGIAQATSTFTHRWYAGITSIMTLSGNGALTITGAITGAVSQDVFNTNSTTVNFAGAATALTIGATTGTTTIRNTNTVISGDLAVNGADITTTATGASTIFNTTTTNVSIAGAATTFALGGTPATALTATLFGNVTGSGVTKTINIGTLGGNGSTTNINLGSAVSGALGTVTVNGGGSATNPSLSISTNSSYSWIRIGTGAGAFPTNDVTTNTRSVGDRIVFSDAANTSIGYVSAGSSPVNSPSLWPQNGASYYQLGGSSMNFTTGAVVNSATVSGGFNFFVPNSEAVADNIGFGAGISPPIFSIFRNAANNAEVATTGIVIRSPRRYHTTQNKNISDIVPNSPSLGHITVTLNNVIGLSVEQVVRITGVVTSTGYNSTVSRIVAIDTLNNTIRLVSSVTETYGSGGVVTPVYATSPSSTTLGIYFDKDDALVPSTYNGSIQSSPLGTGTRSPNLTPVLTFLRSGFITPTQTFELLNHSSITGTLNFGTNINTFNIGKTSSTINIGDFGTNVAQNQTINIATVYSFDTPGSITRNINFGFDGNSASSGVYNSGGSILNIRFGQTLTTQSRTMTTNIGFYGATPVPKASAYTQNYSTTTKTHSASTYAVPSGGTVIDTQARASLGQLAADVTVVKNLINSVIDDLQALGLVG
jgi:hypothetical protein